MCISSYTSFSLPKLKYDHFCRLPAVFMAMISHYKIIFMVFKKFFKEFLKFNFGEKASENINSCLYLWKTLKYNLLPEYWKVIWTIVFKKGKCRRRLHLPRSVSLTKRNRLSVPSEPPSLIEGHYKAFSPSFLEPSPEPVENHSCTDSKETFVWSHDVIT